MSDGSDDGRGPSRGFSEETDVVIALIGVTVIVASVTSWFPPGIAIGIGLVVFGAGLAVTDWRGP